MFRECLDFARQFIGLQTERDGCTSADLGEFLCQDVFPYCGWASNATLRDAVMRLLLTQSGEDLRIWAVSPDATATDAHSKSRKKSISSESLSVAMHETHSTSSKALGQEEALRLLDTGRIQWSVSPQPGCAPLGGEAGAKGVLGGGDFKRADSAILLRVCPSQAMREAALGLSLHTEMLCDTTNFLSENALLGYDRWHYSKSSAKDKYKAHTISHGVSALCRKQWLSLSFMYDTKKGQMALRYFPNYAVPLTEVDKVECHSESASSTRTDRSNPPSGALFRGNESNVADAAYTLGGVANQSKRGQLPLSHYYSRRRRMCGEFPSLVFDLSLIKFVVQTSPDRKLLLQDAVHAILAAHNVFSLKWDSFDRTAKQNWRRMLHHAGLRIVVAKILVRNTRHEVRLVIPAEDLAARLQAKRRIGPKMTRPLSLTQQLKDEDNPSCDIIREERIDGDGAVDPAEGVGMSESEEKECSDVRPIGDTQRRTELATGLFFVSPDFPLPLQAAKEAERRPLALTSVYPNMLFEATEKVRQKSLNYFLESYARRRGTLDTHYVVAKGNKSFSLVYAPKEAAGHAVKSELKTEEGQGSGVPTDASNTRDVRFREGDTSIPKGLSVYAVNKVLEALESAPHHAVTMSQLCKLIDRNSLMRRVLPHLRDTGRLTMTGVNPSRCKKRIGIVVLAGHTLDDETKLLVAQAEKDPVAPGKAEPGQEVNQDAQLPTEILLDTLPAMVGGAGRSELGKRMMTVSAGAKKVADRIMMIRNGFSRHVHYRAGRMHLELWKQWLDAGGPADLVVQSVYNNMSLGTFCVVVGVTGVDLGHFMTSTADNPSTTIAWGSTISHLPPSLQQECHQRGKETFLHALHALQERELIYCSSNITAFMTTPLSDLRITLSPVGSHGTHTLVLHDATSTPGSTAYMILRYWLPIWGSVAPPVVPYAADVARVEPNLTPPKIVALNRVMRVDSGVLAEVFYQRCGITQGLRLRSLVQPSSKTLDTDVQWAGQRAHRKTYRSDFTGVTVAEALDAMFQDPWPSKSLDGLLSLLERGRRVHSMHHALGMPAKVGEGRGHSIYDVSFLRQGGPSYHRGTNYTLLHMSTLGRVAAQLLMARTDEGVHLSRTLLPPTTMKALIEGVFSPNAIAPERESATTLASSVPVPSTTSPVSKANRFPDLLFEQALDTLRMILLSDSAHYSAAMAKELIAAFPPHILARAQSHLQGFPSFRRGTRGGRIARLTLASRPYFLPISFQRQSPLQCPNSALLHSWVGSIEEEAVRMTAGGAHPAFLPSLHSRSHTFDAVLLHQPTMDTANLSAAVKDDLALSMLRVPVLAWPSSAFAMEAPHRRPAASTSTSTSQFRRRPADVHNRRGEDENDDDGSDGDAEMDEEDTDRPCSSARRSGTQGAVTANLYPARTLSSITEPTPLDTVPVDAMPTLREKELVTRGIDAVRKASNGDAHGTEAADAFPYPSIFRHVDGAFHTYVWKVFLHALYRFVLRIPGILHTDLEEKVMSGGLVSHRSFEIGVQHLVDSCVLVRCVTGTHVLQDVGGRSPFKRQRVENGAAEASEIKLGWSYTTTVPPEGLWEMMNLDG